MERRAPTPQAAPTLLACRGCGFGVTSLERDTRGRLVSGYALLQRHMDACPSAGIFRGMSWDARPGRTWLGISEALP